MKLKFSITDKFLWNLYDFFEDVEAIVDFTMSTYTKKIWILTNDNPVIGKYKKEMGRKRFSDFVGRLTKSNYVKVASLKGKEGFIITKEGISKALRASFMIEGKKKRKDGKWIMLIFDIPQRYGKSRSLLRSILENLGYKLFQQSVWITPYDVSDKTEKLLQFHSLEKFVKIFLIEKM